MHCYGSVSLAESLCEKNKQKKWSEALSPADLLKYGEILTESLPSFSLDLIALIAQFCSRDITVLAAQVNHNDNVLARLMFELTGLDATSQPEDRKAFSAQRRPQRALSASVLEAVHREVEPSAQLDAAILFVHASRTMFDKTTLVHGLPDLKAPFDRLRVFCASWRAAAAGVLQDYPKKALHVAHFSDLSQHIKQMLIEVSACTGRLGSIGGRRMHAFHPDFCRR